MWMVRSIQKNIRIEVSEDESFVVNFSDSKEGIFGMIPVFEKLEDAEKFCQGKKHTIVEIPTQ